jgi:hypothetical protein
MNETTTSCCPCCSQIPRFCSRIVELQDLLQESENRADALAKAKNEKIENLRQKNSNQSDTIMEMFAQQDDALSQIATQRTTIQEQGKAIGQLSIDLADAQEALWLLRIAARRAVEEIEALTK